MDFLFHHGNIILIFPKVWCGTKLIVVVVVFVCKGNAMLITEQKFFACLTGSYGPVSKQSLCLWKYLQYKRNILSLNKYESSTSMYTFSSNTLVKCKTRSKNEIEH